MFYGEHEHTIDRKGRLIIPSKFREALKEHYAEKLVVTRGLDQCLFGFPEEEWKAQEQRFRAIPFTKAQSRQFNRLFFSGAVELVWDRQGRILLPQYLKEFAGITRDVVVVGVSNRVEIWAKERWRQAYDMTRGSFEEIAEKLWEPE
ncbi:MAG: division/cell wall cluster transcriptional repressor MraZ [Candidatus Omnitrophica bacterium]|nr:division/cell wall cluster transcriptional repressor MraZ [Candidatus Omnitrophota bacterium]